VHNDLEIFINLTSLVLLETLNVFIVMHIVLCISADSGGCKMWTVVVDWLDMSVLCGIFFLNADRINTRCVAEI